MAANLDYDIIITRYDEIALKSNKVRSRYERLLVENTEAMLREHRSDYSDIPGNGEGYSSMPEMQACQR